MYRRIALLLLAFVFAISVYRAATQSFTTDEAFSHNLFLSGSWSRLFGSYDAAHHVLYSILAKLCITLFGLSEFALRLPALLGCALYLGAAYRLCRKLAPYGAAFLLPLALLSLNPHLMDFFSAARGYGLALALFLWAALWTLDYVEAPTRTGLRRIAFALALAVSANLTLLVPASALGLLLAAAILLDSRLGARLGVRGRWWYVVDGLLLPSVIPAFVILILPLTKATRDHFYFGAASASESLQSLVEMSFFHHPLPERLATILPSPGFWHPLAGVLFPALVGAALAACLLALILAVRRGGFSALQLPARFLYFAGGALGLSVAVLAAAHNLFGVKYPLARTGLYFIPLLVLGATALWAWLGSHPAASRAAGSALAGLGVLCLVQFLALFQCNHYGEWRFDRSTKRIVQLIREDYVRSPQGRVRIGATWMLEPTINFYRRRYRLDWVEPVERGSPDGDYNYYVLVGEDRGVAAKRKLEILFVDRFAEVLLGVRRDGSPALGTIDATPAAE